MPRRPQRAHAKIRFERLVDAADALLAEREADAISLYDIADRAGVPTASVYHFLPSVAAAFVALAERYLEAFRVLIMQPLVHADLTSWHDIFELKCMASREFYNAHDVARKLLLGSEYSWQVRQTDIESNRGYARLIARAYERHFHVPGPCAFIDQIEIGIGMSDSIFALSYHREGEITLAYATEAIVAYHAYMRCYIAERAPKRIAESEQRGREA